MRRLALWALIIVAVIAVASQFALPPIAEDRAADRLTDAGGSADVSISALPAVRLLFGDGDRIEVRGRGLTLPATAEQTGALDALNGFTHVDIRLHDTKIGPVTLRDFALRRDGSLPYALRAAASTSPADLADFGAGQLGPLAGFAIRFGTSEALGAAAQRPIPIDLNMRLADEGGRLVVVSGSGSIAGVPTGPLAELVTAAIAVRL
jgi:hypothetical protein